MKNLNVYVTEAWSGVKKQANNAGIKAWCEKMGIEKYTVNSKGEINVGRGVDLANKDFNKLPYKFGNVNGYFDLSGNENLTSLKNCPDYIKDIFDINGCNKLDSLEGCPKEVGSFYCYDCKGKFTEEEVKSLCKVRRDIML